MPFISGGVVTNITQVPWHVAVYELQGRRFEQICGGTIISKTAVLSAAHCFWDMERNELKDVSQFNVVAGKSFRDYYRKETGMQVFDLLEIRVQPIYQGNANLFNADIAVVRLVKPIIYQTFIAPICLKYLRQNDKVQLG